MEIKVVLDLPRDVVSVPVTRQILDGCLSTLGVAPQTCADIALALSEACANVIQHAGPGEAYEVQVSAKNSKCVIEVINSGGQYGEAGSGANGTVPFPGEKGHGGQPADGFTPAGDPLAAVAERGRGLQIIDAVADNVQLRANQRHGTTVHFEKTLDWLPGAPGEVLLGAGTEGGADSRRD